MNLLVAILKLLLGLPDEPSPAPRPRRRLRPSPAARPETAPEAEPASLEDMFRRFIEEASGQTGDGEAKPAESLPEPGSGTAEAGLESLSDPAAAPPRRRERDGRRRRPERPETASAPPAPPPGPIPPPSALPSPDGFPVSAPAAAARYAAAANAAARPAAGEGGTAARALALRLRGNPGAAREAFIHAEIFGRPLADRPGGGG